MSKIQCTILSGCPVLKYLRLYECGELRILDLSKFLRLRILEVIRHLPVQGPRKILAPHIHCLKLHDSQLSCTLVDVASLTEANLEMSPRSLNREFNGDFLQGMVLKMLEKLKNAEKLTLGRNFTGVKFLVDYMVKKKSQKTLLKYICFSAHIIYCIL